MDPTAPISKALKRLQRNVRRVEKEIRCVMEDEECGYTVNRVEEWVRGGCVRSRYRLEVDMLKVQLSDKMGDCDYVFVGARNEE